MILLSVLALSACDQYLGGISNLSGTWDIYSITQKAYTNSTLDTSSIQNDVGTFTFDSDGTGTYSVENEDNSSSGSFDWFEQNDKVFINPTNFSDSIFTKNLAIGFDVITNTATQQVWSLTYSYYQTEDNPATGYEMEVLKKTYLEIDLRKQ